MDKVLDWGAEEPQLKYRSGRIFFTQISFKEVMNHMVNNNNKNNKNNSSNSLVFGLWPQTKKSSNSIFLKKIEDGVLSLQSRSSYGPTRRCLARKGDSKSTLCVLQVMPKVQSFPGVGPVVLGWVVRVCCPKCPQGTRVWPTCCVIRSCPVCCC